MLGYLTYDRYYVPYDRYYVTESTESPLSMTGYYVRLSSL